MSVLWLSSQGELTYGMCRGDPFAVPAVTLEYGSAAIRGDDACLSEQQAMTCWDTRTKHGFVVSRKSYTVF